MANKKPSSSHKNNSVKIKVRHRRVRVPWWLYLSLLLVAALAVSGYFVYNALKKPSSSATSSAPASSAATSSAVDSSLPSSSTAASSSAASSSASTSSVPSSSGPASSSSATSSSSASTPAASLDIYLMELGNAHTGDSIYIKAGENDILIDAGSNASSASTLVSFLKNKMGNDKELEYVIATHAHTDHIGAFAGTNGIFANFDCRTIIDFPKYGTDKDPTSTTSVFGKYVHARDAEVSGGTSFGAEHYTALDCYSANSEGTSGAHRYYTLGENLKMEILYNYYYDHSQSSGENDYSVCLQFIQGDNHYLFCGDCEEDSEKLLLKNNSLSHCVFYKADHHGSKTSTCPDLMKAITPKYVGISCVAGNYEYSPKTFDYTFPCQRTINTLAPITKAIMVTTLGEAKDTSAFSSFNGTIHVSSQGSTEADVRMEGSTNSTYLKDTDWFKAVGNQIAETVDETETSNYTHKTTDPNRYWPEGGVD